MDCSPSPNARKVIDARGTPCPGPLLKLVNAIEGMNIGEIVTVFSTDEGAKVDCKAWAMKSGNEFMGNIDREGFYEVTVRKLTGEK